MTRRYFDVNTAASDERLVAAAVDDEGDADEGPPASVAGDAVDVDDDRADVDALPSDIFERDDNKRVRLLGPLPSGTPSRISSEDSTDPLDVCDCSLPLSPSKSGDHDRFFFVVAGNVAVACHSGGIVDQSESVPGGTVSVVDTVAAVGAAVGAVEANAGVRKGKTVDNDDEEDAEAIDDSNRRCLTGCRYILPCNEEKEEEKDALGSKLSTSALWLWTASSENGASTS